MIKINAIIALLLSSTQDETKKREYSGTPQKWTTLETNNFLALKSVPKPGTSGTLLVSMVPRNRAVEHNVATSSELYLSVLAGKIK